jgi:hypothetical protein
LHSHRLHTFHFLLSLQLNSRKTPLSVLHVESHRFLLFVSSWVIIVVTTIARGCWCCCYLRELALLLEGACMLHSYNQQSRDTREQVSKLLSFSHSFYLLKLSSKKKKKNTVAQRWPGLKCITAIVVIVLQVVALPTIAATTSCNKLSASLQCCVASLVASTSCNTLLASPQGCVANLTITVNYNTLPPSPQCCVTRSYNATPPPAITVATVELFLSDVHNTINKIH